MVSRKELIASIRARIDSGEWPPGHELPSTSQLMAEFDVSASTVANAMQHLIMIGAVVGRQGAARYVAKPEEPESDVDQDGAE